MKTKELIERPLPKGAIQIIGNMNLFFERWSRSDNTFEDYMGLLHCGFDIPCEDRLKEDEREAGGIDHVDRVLFYFSVADSFRNKGGLALDYRSWMVNGSWWDMLTSEEIWVRQALAQKAYGMLCTRFLDPASRISPGGMTAVTVNRIDLQALLLEDDRLITMLLKFYRWDSLEDGDPVSNLVTGRTHEHEVSKRFLVSLVHLLWHYEETIWAHFSSVWNLNCEKDREMLARIQSAKAWMVEVLHRVGEIRVMHKWVSRLDRITWNKLKEIAIKPEPWSGFEGYGSLEHAFEQGHPAAVLFYRHQSIRDRNVRHLLEKRRKKAAVRPSD